MGSSRWEPGGGSAPALPAKMSRAGPNFEEEDEEIVWGDWHSSSRGKSLFQRRLREVLTVIAD